MSSKRRRGIDKFCGICMENKPIQQIFNKLKCSHTFCSNCVSQHVVAKVQLYTTAITCPEISCNAALEPEMCEGIITREVFNKWGKALCESLYSGSKKMYCPFKNCSGMLLLEGDDQFREAECPHCHRLFCARCEVPWHSEMQCEEFNRVKNMQDDGRSASDERMFASLAEKKKWKSCPNCKFYVEKIDGCFHITCRCGFEFCYGCGSKWDEDVDCCDDEGEDSEEEDNEVEEEKDIEDDEEEEDSEDEEE